MSILFFDDTRFYLRKNLVRDYGKSEAVAIDTFEDPKWLYQWPLGMWQHEGVWQMPILLITSANEEEIQQNVGAFYTAVMYKSTDGENWEPDNRAAEMGNESPLFAHQCMTCADNEEPAYIYYDKDDIPERRFKALSILIDHDAHWVDDVVYCSPDGFNWTRMRGACWNCRGAEPGTSVFRIEEKHTNGLAVRPTWGDRRICISTTDNFQSFTYPQLKLQPDSIDPPETEFYGMRVRPYKGYYIGMLWQYHTLPQTHNKFHEGKMDCHLAYSLNGIDWFRGLRKPFIANGEEGSYDAGMVFPGEISQLADGSLRIYGAAYKFEHGRGYRHDATFVKYALREDGFVKLVAGQDEAYLATRPVILNGGLDINIKCDSPVVCQITNVHGRVPIAGFEFANCTPFTGDSTHWVPQWNGHDISELAGKAVCLHIKFANGEIYAINGDFTPVTCHEAIRYSTQGITVDTTGF